jgi:hypothetical protein
MEIFQIYHRIDGEDKKVFSCSSDKLAERIIAGIKADNREATVFVRLEDDLEKKPSE